jgi:2-dehydro-3-deoxygluconokinase
MTRPRYDVTTFGETMLRMSVPIGARLCDARSLDVEVGGAESNVATALARLGRRVAWQGRLPDNALADAVLRTLRSDGVDVADVEQAAGERIGTYFIELATAPRASQVIYDRAGSAAALMTPEHLRWGPLLDTSALHLTGITAALGPGPYAAVAEAARRALAAGVTVSFDVNYRAKLWGPEAAGAALRPLIAAADVLFCKSADAALLFGCGGEPQAQMEALRGLTRARAIFCTFGERGAALLHEGGFHSLPAAPVQIVDRIGSGDAFAAGALDGLLDGDPELGLRRGVALAAIALSQHGDRVLTTRAELEAVLAKGGGDVAR